jgi:DNA-binding response OmpR family regulator
MIANVLKEAGHAVERHMSGATVLEAMQDQRFDLYILDINTPEVDGLTCLERIDELIPDTPKMIISAYHDIEHIEEAYKLGCADYLKKPFDLEELLIKIKLIEKRYGKPAGSTETVPDEIVIGAQTYLVKAKQLVEGENIVKLSGNEQKLLHLMLTNQGKLLTYEDIESCVWPDDIVDNSTVRTLINRMKNKVDPSLMIEVSRGVGWTPIVR